MRGSIFSLLVMGVIATQPPGSFGQELPPDSAGPESNPPTAPTEAASGDVWEAIGRLEQRVEQLSREVEQLRLIIQGQANPSFSPENHRDAPGEDEPLGVEPAGRVNPSEVERLELEIERLRREGRLDEAAAVQHQLDQLLYGGEPQRGAAREPRSGELQRMQDEIERLRRAGRPDEADAVQHELHQLRQRSAPQQGAPAEEFSREIQRMEQEIERLRDEGRLNEAAALEREFNQLRQAPQRLGGAPQELESGELQRLEAEAERFRREGRSEEATILSREIEGLRRQSERLGTPPFQASERMVTVPEAAPPMPTQMPRMRLALLGNPLFSWQAAGGPSGGLGYDIRMRPDNPDTVFVTDSWAGVFRSHNGGQQWQAANGASEATRIDARAGLSGDAIPVFSLTIDPLVPNRIWVGTQNLRGIFRSDDGGNSWQRADQGVQETNGISFRGFAVDPNNRQVVYAAAEISSIAWAGAPRIGKSFDKVKGAVYKTTNGGNSWQRIWFGDNLARYVMIHPKQSNVLYVSTGIFDREAANSEAKRQYPGGVGVLKSTDGGQTWKTVNNGLGNLYVGSLFMHPHQPDVLLAGTGCNSYEQAAGVYLTENGGSQWQQVLAGEIITSVEFCKGQSNVAYAGSSSAIYRSNDRGRTWQRQTRSTVMWGPPGVRAGWPIDFESDPRSADRLLANAYGGGAFLTKDGGRTWENASRGYTGAQIRRLAVDPQNSQRVVAAGRSGLFVTQDSGQTWDGLIYPPAFQLDWNALAIDPLNSQHMLAGNSWGAANLCETFDGGRSWRVAASLGVPKMGWSVVKYAPKNGLRAYAGTGSFISASNFDRSFSAKGVYASHDGGHSWVPANDQLTANAQIADLAIDPEFPSLVYAASTTHGMLKTTDGGQRWTAINQGLPMTAKARPLCVALHPVARGILYCGLEGGGVYRSTDAGNSWQPLGSGMEPNATVADIAIQPSNPDVLFAADLHSGVYHFVSGYGRWERVNHGLTMRCVNALAFSADGGVLYAGTEGNGVYLMRLLAAASP